RFMTYSYSATCFVLAHRALLGSFKQIHLVDLILARLRLTQIAIFVGLIAIAGLIPPGRPPLAFAASEQFEVRCRRARLNDRKLSWRRPGASVRAFLPRMPNRTSSVTLRKQKPTPRPSEPPSFRILCQTMLALYAKPHAFITARPSGRSAFGHHK